jgi:hypothetical protein
MTTTDPATHPHDSGARAGTIARDASLAELAAGETLRGIEIAVIVVLGLLVCPPLAILTVLLVVPALVVGLLVAILSAPYLLVHHLRASDRRHASLLAHRLGAAGRALVDVLPHRIVAEARRLDHAGR